MASKGIKSKPNRSDLAIILSTDKGAKVHYINPERVVPPKEEIEFLLSGIDYEMKLSKKHMEKPGRYLKLLGNVDNETTRDLQRELSKENLEELEEKKAHYEDLYKKWYGVKNG